VWHGLLTPNVDSATVKGLQMPVVWSPRHRGHAPDGGYWLGVREAGDEEPERGDMLHDGLVAAGVTIVDPPDLGLAPIVAVHDPDFVDFMRRVYPAWVAEGHLSEPGQPHVVGYLFANAGFAARYRKERRPATIRAELGLYAMDTMSLMSEGTFDAACSAVHAAVHAADLVAGGERAGYAAVRPPGHHAGPAFFGGSCYFNNAAAAAQRLRDAGFGRVAIVDIDAHQGNDTQEIFWNRDDVLYASVHVDPADGWFPHIVGYADERGGGAGEGWTHNEPIPAGSGDEPWLAALDRLLHSVDAHGSDALVVSLGVDAAVDDPAAPLMVTSDGFRTAGERLSALGLPTVFVQEGGYDLSRLAALVLDVLQGFDSFEPAH
jgi:acetoin utilization deacetylase AcuC-like enzyme